MLNKKQQQILLESLENGNFKAFKDVYELKNIIKTSQDIGFKTLCEGIETKEQEEAAIKAGCDLLQGYYYYKPMPVAMLENLFDNHSGGI